MSVVDATTTDLSIYPIHPSIYLYLGIYTYRTV